MFNPQPGFAIEFLILFLDHSIAMDGRCIDVGSHVDVA
jgi:hypothetical protein